MFGDRQQQVRASHLENRMQGTYQGYWDPRGARQGPQLWAGQWGLRGWGWVAALGGQGWWHWWVGRGWAGGVEVSRSCCICCCMVW